jgi:uncharacterized membrane protein
MIIKYFVRGLLFITPIGVTSLIMFSVYDWVIEKIQNVHMQGLTITFITIAFFVGITILGYFGSTFLIKPIAQTIEKIISKTPLINFVYSSIKDLSGAFMGDKKKFDQPIMVNLDSEGILKKPGFITREDLNELGIDNMVAVYLPHSYNFSGNVFFTEPKNITKIHNVSSGEYMKFIVSGGVSGDMKVKAPQK